MPLPEGDGSNGVLLLGEALGEQEATVGKPFQGRAGEAFTRMLLRRDLRRELFTIDNAIRCRPPDNKLNHQPYEALALARCSHFLDATIAARRPRVIVAMGEIPLQRVLGLGKEEKITPWRGYVTWSAKYQAHVIGTFHPSYIMRGNAHLSGVFLHDIEHALEIAAKGYIPHNQVVHCDPPPHVVEAWVRQYEQGLRLSPQATWLACDIETPHKAEHMDEGELDVDDPSYVILRIGFSYKEGEALSIPWQSHYLPLIQRLLTSGGVKLWWNGRYDIPRIRHNGMGLGGDQWDLMWGWHVINSDLPMGLAFVAPMLAKGQARWKHLGQTEPARYNGIDAEVTRRIATTLVQDLKQHHLWDIAFDRHVVKLDVVLDHMSTAGVPVDEGKRHEVSATLQTKLTATREEMQTVAPLAAKRLKQYKTKAKGVEWAPGMPPPVGYTVVLGEGVARTCSVCGAPSPKKPHFRVLKKKVNACAAGEVVETPVPVERLARIEPFVPSVVQLTTYATNQGHKLRTTKGDKGPRITFDDMALRDLMRAYPNDPMYPLVLDYREYEKLLSTYVGEWDPILRTWVGGPPVGPDGRVHCDFTHAPSTLRLSSRNPNMQNIPRGDEEDSEEKQAIKRLFVPEAGHAFFEVDYKAIEAVLVGYFANDPAYVRLAKLGVHDFLNGHILYRADKIAQPPDLAWSDADLRAQFKDWKRRFNTERNVAKRAVHGCLTGEHEVLTTQGWVRLDAYDRVTPLAEWENGRVVFRRPKAFYAAMHSGYLVGLRGRGLDVLMTPDHTVPVLTTQGHIRPYAACKLPRANSIPVTGTKDGEAGIPPGLLLAAAAQADGTVVGHALVFHLKRPRKINRLLELVPKAHVRSNKDGTSTITVKRAEAAPVWRWLDSPSKWFRMEALLALGQEARRAFLVETTRWDGSIKGPRREYCTTNHWNAVVVQTLAHVSGHQALFRVEMREGRYPFYKVSFNRRKAASVECMARWEQPANDVPVFCPVTTAGYFLVRRNDRVSVTGNSNYGMTPSWMSRLYPEYFPKAQDAALMQGLYFEVCPGVRRWQDATVRQAHDTGYLRNPFGYMHRFWQVLTYTKDRSGQWSTEWGEDAKRALAFLPQSTAAGIIKEALLRLYYDHGNRAMRLQVHDSLLNSERGGAAWEDMATLTVRVMREPSSYLPLPWAPEEMLAIDVEAKAGAVGTSWGDLEEVRV